MGQINKKIRTRYLESYLDFSSIIEKPYFVRPIKNGIESNNYIISIGHRDNFKFILKVYLEDKNEEVKYEVEILRKLNLGMERKYFPIIVKGIFYIDKKPAILLKYIPGKMVSKNSVSRRLVKEIASLGGSISAFLIPEIEEKVVEYYKNKK